MYHTIKTVKNNIIENEFENVDQYIVKNNFENF
jgi:hypothetical protein